MRFRDIRKIGSRSLEGKVLILKFSSFSSNGWKERLRDRNRSNSNENGKTFVQKSWKPFFLLWTEIWSGIYHNKFAICRNRWKIWSSSEANIEILVNRKIFSFQKFCSKTFKITFRTQLKIVTLQTSLIQQNLQIVFSRSSRFHVFKWSFMLPFSKFLRKVHFSK